MNKPTESELAILQLLWRHQPCSVRTINDLLNKQRTVGYTTTLKIMQIMFEKGLVLRDASQRSHMYSSNIKEEETKQSLLSDFVSNTFKGSRSALVLSALGDGNSSQEELDEIKAFIASLENNKSL